MSRMPSADLSAVKSGLMSSQMASERSATSACRSVKTGLPLAETGFTMMLASPTRDLPYGASRPKYDAMVTLSGTDEGSDLLNWFWAEAAVPADLKSREVAGSSDRVVEDFIS